MLNVLLFISTYISGFLLTFIYNPATSFALYEAVYFYYPQNRWWGKMLPDASYSFYVVILIAITLLFQFNRLKSFRAFSSPQIKWMFSILILYGLASFYAFFPEQHYDSFIFFLKAVIIISMALKLCDTDSKLNLYLYGYIFGSWYISFVAYQVGRNSGDRVEGIGTVDAPEANTMAAAIAPSLVLCLYYFWTSEKKIFKALFAIAGIFIANALVLINSRGAFLGAAISISFFMGYMYFSSFQTLHQKKITVIIALLGLSGAAYLIDDSFRERMYSIQQTEASEEKETGSTRLFFWKAAWDMTKDHPLGSGWKGFNAYADRYIPVDVDTGGRRSRSVHSTWFEALTEIGYLGLFSLIMMIYATFKSLKTCKRVLKESSKVHLYFKVVAIEAALISFIISMTFINRLRAEVFYWLILYTAIAYNVYVANKPNINIK